MKEWPPKGAFNFKQDRAEDQRRETGQDHQRGDQRVPCEDRHLVKRHTRRTVFQDRHGQLNRRTNRRNLDKGDANQPEIGVDPRRVQGAGEGRIHEPPAIGRDPKNQRDQQH